MRLFKIFSFFLIVSILAAVSISGAAGEHYLSFSTPAKLRAYFHWTPKRSPLLCAHRGGPLPGYPENCIATFENSLSYGPCLIECDVRKTKDSALVLMHDSFLSRTTTGQGHVGNYTLKELKQLRLKDEMGRVTPYQIPTLAEALDWARNKVIVELDVKSPVTPEEIVAAIREKNAESYAVAITYDVESALHYHELNPNLMIAAPAKGFDGAQFLLKSGINPEYLLAFLGVYEPPQGVYDLLHGNGITTLLGTIGNLDRKAKRLGAQVYVQLLKNGADILVTDNVPLATEAIREIGNKAKKIDN